MVMEELYYIVDSIADLTVEDVRRHLSNSESSSGGDTEENIGAGDNFAIRKSWKHGVIRGDEGNEGKWTPDEKKAEKGRVGKSIELNRKNHNDEEKTSSDTLRKVELRVSEAEELAMKAVREASNVVAGMISGTVTGDNATEAVVEAANAVAALITVAEEDLEASVLVKDVQARLQHLQALQPAIREQETNRARAKVPKESEIKKTKFSCTTNTRFFMSLSQKPR